MSLLWIAPFAATTQMLRPFLDTTWHQRFSGVALATRAEASTARYPLDPDGCLVRVHSQPANEKTDAVLVLNIEAARMIGREQPDQMLRGIRFTLDFDRLMGGPHSADGSQPGTYVE